MVIWCIKNVRGLVIVSGCCCWCPVIDFWGCLGHGSACLIQTLHPRVFIRRRRHWHPCKVRTFTTGCLRRNEQSNRMRWRFFLSWQQTRCLLSFHGLGSTMHRARVCCYCHRSLHDVSFITLAIWADMVVCRYSPLCSLFCMFAHLVCYSGSSQNCLLAFRIDLFHAT